MINFNHAPEMIILLVIAFMVFGPEKLPELARGAGRGLREFRRMSSELQEGLRTQIGDPLKEVQQEMQQQVQDITQITNSSLQQPFTPPVAATPAYMPQPAAPQPEPATVSPAVAESQHDSAHVAPVADVPAARAPIAVRRPSAAANLGALSGGAGSRLTLAKAAEPTPAPAADTPPA